MKKKLIGLLVVALCFTLVLAACTASEPQITSQTTEITDVYIGDEVAIPQVVATDEKDGDITSNVTVKVVRSGRTVAIKDNKFVPTESGEYNIVYSVTNSSKKTGSFNIKVTVKDKIVIGYDARTVSGLTDEIIANFKVALQAYVDDNFNGALVVVRGYNQTTIDAVELGQQINADGDCDILMGFGSNLSTSTESSGSGVSTLAKQKVPMAGKTSSNAMRYVYKVKETNISNAIYNWICTEGGDAQESLKIPPQTKLVIGWDGRTATTGLTEEIMSNFTVALTEYLSTLGDYSTIVPEIRKYDAETTQEIGAQINAAGDVDVLVGFGANVNLSSGANVACVHMAQTQMGGKSRYVCQLNEGALSALVYDWLIAGNASEALALPTVVVAYNNTITALSNEIIFSFTGAVNDAKLGLTVQVQGYATKEDANSADILLGFDGQGTTESATIIVASQDTIVERTNDKESTKAVFAWMQTTDAEDSLSDIEKTTSIVLAFDMRTSSGLTEEIKADVIEAFKQYLVANGYDLSTLTITDKSYTGDSSVIVGELINTDGDVDILIGSGGNMFTDWGSTPAGVVTFEERSAFDVAIGTKTKRSIARLSKTNLSVLAYSFLTSESGRKVLSSAVEIAYNSNLEVSQTVLAQFNQAIKDADFGVNVTFTSYDSAELASNASILLGFDSIQSQLTQVISVNGVDKNLDKIETSAVVNMIYTWMQTQPAIDALVEPSQDEEVSQVVVGWWSYYNTNPGDKSGLTESQVTAYASALKTYLESKGYQNVQVVVVAFSDSTAKKMGDSIRAYNEANSSAPVDIMLGVGSNFNLSSGANITTASMRGVYEVNNVSNRYFATVQNYGTNTQIVKDALDWTISEAGLAELGSVTKTN